MRAPPLKPEYGPSLPELLRPHWRRWRTWERGLAVAGAAALLALVAAGAIIWPRQGHYQSSGPVSFSFSYPRSLHRVAPDRGGYVKVARFHRGRLELSFAVDGLVLAPYFGDPQGEVPIFAERYVRRLRRTLPGFTLIGEGRARMTSVSEFVYQIVYQYRARHDVVLARNLMLLADRAGATRGLVLVVRGTAQAAGAVSATTLAGSGDLSTPLTSFSLG